MHILTKILVVLVALLVVVLVPVTAVLTVNQVNFQERASTAEAAAKAEQASLNAAKDSYHASVTGLQSKLAGIEKTAALASHHSQQDWLAETQKMNQYLATMERYSREVGKLSRRFKHAEGWRRHLHWGYCAEEADPLRDALGKNCLINRRYEAALERGE